MPVIVDIFPIQLDIKQYPLAAFSIDASNAVKIGATLAYRSKKILGIPCAWDRDYKILVASAELTEEKLTTVLRELWEIQLDGFDLVNGVSILDNWYATPNAIAQFVVRGIFNDSKGWIKNAFKSERRTIGIVSMKREEDLKGIVVQGEPAVQISIRTPMKSTRTLQDIYDPNNPDHLVNTSVKCDSFSGVVDSIVGYLVLHPVSNYAKALRQT